MEEEKTELTEVNDETEVTEVNNSENESGNTLIGMAIGAGVMAGGYLLVTKALIPLGKKIKRNFQKKKPDDADESFNDFDDEEESEPNEKIS